MSESRKTASGAPSDSGAVQGATLPSSNGVEYRTPSVVDSAYGVGVKKTKKTGKCGPSRRHAAGAFLLAALLALVPSYL